MIDSIHVYFSEAMDSIQCRPPNAYQDISNTNQFDRCHFRTVIGDSNSLLFTPFLTVSTSATRQCMASSVNKQQTKQKGDKSLFTNIFPHTQTHTKKRVQKRKQQNMPRIILIIFSALSNFEFMKKNHIFSHTDRVKRNATPNLSSWSRPSTTNLTSAESLRLWPHH